MAKLGVGVLGVGTMGKQHAQNIRRLIPEARLVAIADADLKRAQQVASELEIEHAYGSVEALVERRDIQAVVVVTPAKFHSAAMRVCTQAGKDIFCEKPFTLTVEEADELLDLTAKAGVRVQVGHVRRYDPPNVKAKQRIEAGEIGDPVIFKSLARDPAPPPVSYMASGVNGMFFALFNDIDTALLNMKFSRGTLGAVENYMQSGYGYDVRTEIVGSKGTIITGYLQQTAEVVLTATGAKTDIVDHFLVRFAEGYLNEMRDFVQTVLADREPKVDAFDGRQAVAVAAAAERSYRDGRAVAVANRARSSRAA